MTGALLKQGRRRWASRLPTQVLADQLTLSQPEGAYCAPNSTACPPRFR